MQGIITRGVGGFYYALDAQGQIHQLRAQAKLRRAHLKPMVGDQVEFEPGTEEEDGWLKMCIRDRRKRNSTTFSTGAATVPTSCRCAPSNAPSSGFAASIAIRCS